MLDLSERKAKGEFVKGKDLKKHKNDVFRLLPIVRTNTQIHLEGMVKEKVREFMKRIKNEGVAVENFGVGLSFEDAIGVLSALYNV